MDNLKEEYRLSYRRMQDPPEPALPTASEQVLLQSQSTGFWGSSWALEVISSVVAVAALVAIIAVLYIYDGKPIPDWPYSITLNALISMLSTVMKAALAFPITEALSQLKWSWFNRGNKLSDLSALDAASRGAIGAFMILFRFLPRHLVSIGCLILVVGAAIAPFVQQVIAINLRPVPSSGVSSIEVCNSSTYTDYDEGAGPGMNEVPLSTAGAIYTGLFQSASPHSNAVTLSCPTGNCTFDPYQSLGICTRCANITDQLANSSNSFGTLMQYDFKLPNGFHFETASNEIYLMNGTVDLPLLRVDTGGVPSFLNFTAISAAGYGVPPSVSATECALYFCVNTFHSSVTQGSFNETRVSSRTSSNATSSVITEDLFLTPETCYKNGTRHQSTDDCTYHVNWFSGLALSNSLRPLLHGNGSLFISNRPSWSSDTLKAVYGTQGNYTDVSSVFHSLSSALTTHARSKVCHALVTGKTWTMESFVQVRWLWMVLPIALVALGFVFLVVTIVKTKNQYIWKSSPLALLFSDLSVDAPHSIRASPSLSGMEDTSKKMNVWLETTNAGVRLKGIPG
ncbi:DUF3176 domain-containing protein [Aspergillus affinis]|uniref:DUF3176 domain-containing protein n=1 Tax=Aspergillus affinis TaxID=1070780 RepID=UPI0022FEFCF4|nr:uncharacterized protein KD926_006368 [Aspergillus affinis]KAI9041824.1 hypothetical protein KD926_006368 [Aspergillus affinis]